jgi:hypothetical protein
MMDSFALSNTKHVDLIIHVLAIITHHDVAGEKKEIINTWYEKCSQSFRYILVCMTAD